MSPEESELFDQLLANKVSASPERKRRRNPIGNCVLKEWGNERGGEKISEL